MWDGSLPVRHAIYLTEHLQLNPRSRIFARRGGAPELQGWDTHAIMLARLHNVVVSALGGSEDQFIKYPSKPGTDGETEGMQYRTIADFSAAGFDNFMYGG